MPKNHSSTRYGHGPALSEILSVSLVILLVGTSGCNSTIVNVADGAPDGGSDTSANTGSSSAEPTGGGPTDAPGTTESTDGGTTGAGPGSTEAFDESTTSGAASETSTNSTSTAGTTMSTNDTEMSTNDESSGDNTTNEGATGSGEGYDALAVSASYGSTCVIRSGGAVRCWGWPYLGELGYGVLPAEIIGDDESPSTVGDVPMGGDVLQLDSGAGHRCAVLTGGGVRCWGSGSNGMLGYANTNNVGLSNTPADVGDVKVGGSAVMIETGYSFTCALLDTGDVRCWGQGGLLGTGGTEDIGDDEHPSAGDTVALSAKATAIALGEFHACALLESAKLQCWGVGAAGQLGYGNTNDIGDDELPSSAGTVDVGGDVAAVAAGGSSTCALLTSGKVQCWGYEGNGRLGHGDLVRIGDDESPSDADFVELGGTATAIAMGAAHVCALLDGGDVRCWGRGNQGRLGIETEDDIGDDEIPTSVEPVSVGGTVGALTAGEHHTCARLAGGSVRCWGASPSGELGYGNTLTIGDNEAPADAGDVPFI